MDPYKLDVLRLLERYLGPWDEKDPAEVASEIKRFLRDETDRISETDVREYMEGKPKPWEH